MSLQSFALRPAERDHSTRGSRPLTGTSILGDGAGFAGSRLGDATVSWIAIQTSSHSSGEDNRFHPSEVDGPPELPRRGFHYSVETLRRLGLTKLPLSDRQRQRIADSPPTTEPEQTDYAAPAEILPGGSIKAVGGVASYSRVDNRAPKAGSRLGPSQRCLVQTALPAHADPSP